MSSENLPQEGDSQEIGHHAIDTFNSNRPASWRVDFLDSDKDVGIDGQVQVVENGKYQRFFHVQIKGSRSRRRDGKSEKLNVSGDYYSVTLEDKTINYYSKVGTPIMLVFADLAPGLDARDCPAYYLWIHELVDRQLNTTNKSKRKSHTFQVPVSQKLTRDLDITGYLASRTDSLRIGRELYQSIAEHADRPEEAASRIAERFAASKLVVDSLVVEEAENPWVDAPAGTLARNLQRTMGYLESHNVDLAVRELSTIEDKISAGTNHERAEFNYQRGLAQEIPGDYKGAEAFHAEAYKLMPAVHKYLIALLECRIGLGINGEAEYEDMLNSIQGKEGPRWRRLRAKIMAILKREKDAIAEIGADESAAGLTTKSLILFLCRNTEGCSVICNDAIQRGVGNAHQKLILRMTRVRLGFESGFPQAYSRELIPYCGLDEMNIAIMQQVWEDIEECWRLAHEMNYPREVELLVDITAILGGFLGQERKHYDHLKRSADHHIHRSTIQEVVLQFAQFIQDDDRVRLQLDRVTDENTRSFHYSMMLFRVGEKLKALTEVLRLSEGLAPEEIEAFLPAFERAAICADESAKSEEREILLDVIKKAPGWGEKAPVFNYSFKVNANELYRTEGLKELYRLFREGNQSRELSERLFAELGIDRKEDCEALIDVSGGLRACRALSRRETLKLCHAYASIGRWKGVLNCSREGMKRFGGDSGFHAVQAWAYDGLGDTPRALELVEQALAEEEADLGAFELYVEIAVRCGLLEKAKGAIEELLSRAKSQKRKCRYQMTLLKIEMAIDPASPRLWEYWKRVGPLTDREDEVEEGTFLLMLLQVSSYCNEDTSEEFKLEVQDRMRAYFERFPESKVFRQVMIPDHLEGEQLLDYLDRIAGSSRERRQEERELADRFHGGQLRLPYSLRPFIFREIQDLILLFYLTKHKRKGDRVSELCLGSVGAEVGKIQALKTKPPLVDEVTLLVLSELGMVGKLFDIFPRVFISRGTLRRLVYFSQCQYTSLSYERARKLRDELSGFMGSIHQIPDPPHGGDDVLSELEHLQKVLGDIGLALYCDDLITRQLLLGEAHLTECFTTVDFIRFLRDSGRLEEREATEKLAELCGWNVSGIPLAYHEILSVMVGEGLAGSSLKEIDSNFMVNNMLELVWDVRQDYSFCLRNFVGLAGYVLCASCVNMSIAMRTSVVALLWNKWALRMMVFSHGEPNRVSYYLRALIEIALYTVQLKGDEWVSLDTAGPIWKSCQDARERAVGNEMTMESERTFIYSVGSTASGISEVSKRDDCVRFLLSGLDNERERAAFNDGYLEARVSQEF